MKPLVSIITPAYNVENFIGETIGSVIAQTYENWELIIIDDHSKDDTYNTALKAALNDSRIKVLKTLKNGGAAAARNHGIKAATGNFISFLDSDDLWDERKLELQVPYMLRDDVFFSCTAYKMINETGKYIRTVGVPSYINYTRLLKGCEVGCLTAMYNVDKLGKRFFLEPADYKHLEIKAREDYMLWLELAKRCPDQTMIGIDLPLATYRRRDGGISSNKLDIARSQWRVYRHIEKLGIVNAGYYFLNYAINGFRKHYL